MLRITSYNAPYCIKTVYTLLSTRTVTVRLRQNHLCYDFYFSNMGESRRAVIGVFASVLVAGCVSDVDDGSGDDSGSGSDVGDSSDGEPQENGEFGIVSVKRVDTYKPDSGLSALGYVKFIEIPARDTVAVIQSIIAERSSCDDVSMRVSPKRGSISEDEISVTVSKETVEQPGGCVSNNAIASPQVEAIELLFDSLPAGQKITVGFDESNISVSYITTGESNTESREPIEVPDNVRI